MFKQRILFRKWIHIWTELDPDPYMKKYRIWICIRIRIKGIQIRNTAYSTYQLSHTFQSSSDPDHPPLLCHLSVMRHAMTGPKH